MNNQDCIFCKIIAGTSPGEIVYQDDLITAFRDIHPVAPIHILIVPNSHISSINDLSEKDQTVAGCILLSATKIAAQLGISHNGYRLIINTGKDGGQVIHHLHAHMMGGQRMRFPIG